MNEDLTRTAMTGNLAAVDTFQALAKIALTSAERLSALNLSAAREMVEDQSALARAMLGTRSPGDLGEIQSGMAQPLMNKALAYSRGTYEILTEAQSDLTQLMASRLPMIGGPMRMPDWGAAFEMFRSGARQFSDMAAQNVATATDAAASAGTAMKKSA
jgi:phasin family protein